MGLAPVERIAMRRFWKFVLLLLAALPAHADPPTGEVCVIVGTPGDDSFAPGFAGAAQKWQDACKLAGATCTVIGLEDEKGADPVTNTLDHDKLVAWISHLDPKGATPAWIIYLGHGTFDGKDARLNLRGVDISAVEMANLLKPVTRPLIFIHGGSASAPFINALSAPNRIIVTATQSGREVDYARFGEKFAETLTDPTADIDQDGQVSVLESFVTAAQRAQDFYMENDRMATEHALLDDNGDKRGTPASFYQGTRLVQQPDCNVEPECNFALNIALITSAAERALTDEQRNLRTVLESEMEGLRQQKDTLPEDDYYAQLEKIVRQLQGIYVKTAASGQAGNATPPEKIPPAADLPSIR